MLIAMDMDPGIDDAIALMLAVSDYRIRVKAVSIVSGNVDVKQGSMNALRILDALGYDIPVYIGASKPLKRKPIYAKDIHGEDGLGYIDLKPKRQAIYDLPKAYDSIDAVIATAPLTNIANMIKFIDKVYLMGGIYEHKQVGNVTSTAEFNFYVDPEAADIVIRSNKDIVACGLEVTNGYAIDKDFLDKLYSINSMKARIAYKMLRYPIYKFKYFHLYDVYALFALLEPSMFDIRKIKVMIDPSNRGRCVLGRGNYIKVCKCIDHERFNKLLLELIR